MIDREYRACAEIELRSEPDGKVTLRGYAAVFNSLSQDLGGFVEIIRPGAFTRTLASGADVRLLVNHEGTPLARTKSGTLRLAEDQRGLRMEADLDPSDPDVQALVPKIRRGDMDQMSFGFTTKSDIWRQEGDRQIRELHNVDLFDVSAVTYPAYQATEMALRSLERAKAAAMAAGDPLAAHFARLTLAEERANGISTRPSAGMASAAREGLRLHEEGKSGDGLKPETVARAKRISARESLTEDHVIEMAAWFKRHATASKSPGWDKAGEEKPGYVAWQLWGGDAGASWSASKADQIKAARE
jgi:HK97 family phage prohead protease